MFLSRASVDLHRFVLLVAHISRKLGLNIQTYWGTLGGRIMPGAFSFNTIQGGFLDAMIPTGPEK